MREIEWNHVECGADVRPLPDGRKPTHVMSIKREACVVDGEEVVAAMIDGQWFLIASDPMNDVNFPPRGPYAKEAAAALLRFSV